MRVKKDEWSRLVARASVQLDGCWVWQGCTTKAGYGLFWSCGRAVQVHRRAYQLQVGPIPDSLVIDHKCHNRLCVRPDHLRVVTGQVNQEHRRGPNRTGRSGFRNVSWCKAKSRWHVQIGYRGRSVNGGYYTSIEEAARAAEALRAQYHTPPP